MDHTAVYANDWFTWVSLYVFFSISVQYHYYVKVRRNAMLDMSSRHVVFVMRKWGRSINLP